MSIYKKILCLSVLITPFFLNGQTQLGGDIDGEAARDLSGFAVALSEEGDTVAIGANKNDATGFRFL